MGGVTTPHHQEAHMDAIYTIDIGLGASAEYMVNTEDEMWQLVRRIANTDAPNRPHTITVYRSTPDHDERVLTIVTH
jgi:hypothetical protein